MTTYRPLVRVGGIAADLPATDVLEFNGQLPFPATQNPSADANTLDDYEEGLFTPGLQFGGAAAGMTGTFLGRYVKIGSRVFFDVRILLTAKGSSTGAAAVSNLPFSATASPAGLLSTGIVFALSLTTVAVPVWFTSGTTLVLYDFTASSGTGLSQSDFTDTSSLAISGSYSV